MELEPRSEPLRKAVQWISDRRREQPEVPLARLIDEAGLRFDLSPQQQQFLLEELLQK
jgi:hypothetical protein